MGRPVSAVFLVPLQTQPPQISEKDNYYEPVPFSSMQDGQIEARNHCPSVGVALPLTACGRFTFD